MHFNKSFPSFRAQVRPPIQSFLATLIGSGHSLFCDSFNSVLSSTALNCSRLRVRLASQLVRAMRDQRRGLVRSSVSKKKPNFPALPFPWSLSYYLKKSAISSSLDLQNSFLLLLLLEVHSTSDYRSSCLSWLPHSSPSPLSQERNLAPLGIRSGAFRQVCAQCPRGVLWPKERRLSSAVSSGRLWVSCSSGELKLHRYRSKEVG